MAREPQGSAQCDSLRVISFLWGLTETQTCGLTLAKHPFICKSPVTGPVSFTLTLRSEPQASGLPMLASTVGFSYSQTPLDVIFEL